MYFMISFISVFATNINWSLNILFLTISIMLLSKTYYLRCVKMNKIEQLIIDNNLIKEGETIAVACSGGQDSMCLLNILMHLKHRLKYNLVAVNVDHGLRATSANDSSFVKKYCERHDIKLYSFTLDINKLCANKKLGVEQGAREGRYQVFNKLLDDGVVNKIALGHHMQDQAETILLNIFRGAGVAGACGMELNRDNRFIRPLLYTPKTEIQAYIQANDIPFVEDETNLQNDYSRNYIRNMIMPLIRNRWQNADATICEFGKLCRRDNEFINSQISKNAIIKESSNTVKAYSSYFFNHPSLTSRLIFKALKQIGASVDIEKKHLNLVCDLAMNGDNGAKINLPNGVVVIKEYGFITFTNKKLKANIKPLKLKRGKFNVPGVGVLEVYISNNIDINAYQNVFDAKKVDKNAVWRFRKNGDVFEKFGGGTKSLNEFFIDRKVPSRFRDVLPVLAVGNEILVVAGVEISDKVKVDKDTTQIYGVNFITF